LALDSSGDTNAAFRVGRIRFWLSDTQVIWKKHSEFLDILLWLSVMQVMEKRSLTYMVLSDAVMKKWSFTNIVYMKQPYRKATLPTWRFLIGSEAFYVGLSFKHVHAYS